ncbi:MAG: hypothetical protein RMY36_026380 [Nostoc sp. SerVER01]
MAQPLVEKYGALGMEIIFWLYRPAPLLHRPAPLLHRPAPLLHRPAPLLHRPAPLLHRPAPLLHRPAKTKSPQYFRQRCRLVEAKGLLVE